jgi:hypothetical protein
MSSTSWMPCGRALVSARRHQPRDGGPRRSAPAKPPELALLRGRQRKCVRPSQTIAGAAVGWWAFPPPALHLLVPAVPLWRPLDRARAWRLLGRLYRPAPSARPLLQCSREHDLISVIGNAAFGADIQGKRRARTVPCRVCPARSFSRRTQRLIPHPQRLRRTQLRDHRNGRPQDELACVPTNSPQLLLRKQSND